jgi:hypothetical protein
MIKRGLRVEWPVNDFAAACMKLKMRLFEERAYLQTYRWSIENDFNNSMEK